MHALISLLVLECLAKLTKPKCLGFIIIYMASGRSWSLLVNINFIILPSFNKSMLYKRTMGEPCKLELTLCTQYKTRE